MMKELVLEFSIIEDKVRRQMIYSSRIDKQRVKIKALQTVFNIIDEYDIDNETRQDYLNNGIWKSHITLPLLGKYDLPPLAAI